MTFRTPRVIREFCRKVFVRLYEVPGNIKFLEYCVTRRVLIDQLVHKYLLSDIALFESYLHQTNPNESYLNKIIMDDCQSLLAEVLDDSKSYPLNKSGALWGVDQIWLIAAWQLKDVYRKYEFESCSCEINLKTIDQLINQIELRIKPYLLNLWGTTKGDPLFMKLLFPLTYKSRRQRVTNTLLTWLTNQAPAEESALRLFQSALLSTGFDQDDLPFLSLSDTLKQLWRARVSDDEAELPVEPIELIPTSLIFPDHEQELSTSFTLMSDALNYHKKRQLPNFESSAIESKDSLSAREIDSMTIYLGLLLISSENLRLDSNASFERTALEDSHERLSDWFTRLVLLMPDSVTAAELAQA